MSQHLSQGYFVMLLFCNLLLALALVLLSASLSVHWIASSGRAPCSFLFGALFLLLFVLIPLVSNLTYGVPVTLHGGQPGRMIVDVSFGIYGVSILLFSLTFLAFSLVSVGSRKNTHESVRSSRAFSRIDRCITNLPLLHSSIGLAVIGGVGLFVFGSGLSLTELFLASRFAWYAADEFSSPLITLGLYLVTLVSVYSYLDTVRGLPCKSLSFLVYAAILILIVLAGGRKWLFFVMSGVLAGYFDRNDRFSVNPSLLLAAIGVAFVGFAWQFWRAINWAEIDSLLLVGAQFLEHIPTLIAEGDATYFYRASVEAIKLNESSGVIYPLAMVYQLLLMPIPNEFTFGVKLEGLPYLFADAMNAGNEVRRGNLPPGLLGLFVLSFGWQLALLLAPIVTLGLVHACDHFIRRTGGIVRYVVFANFAAVALLIMRGNLGALYFLAFSVIVVFSLHTLLLALAIMLRRQSTATPQKDASLIRSVWQRKT